MNVKALAAVVGTLSLASLAAGCASTKAVQAEKGADQGSSAQVACTAGKCGSCQNNAAAAKTDAASSAETPATGEASCSGSK